MDRRTFLIWIGVGTLVSSLPAVIAACSQDLAETTPTTKLITVGNISELDSNQFIFNETNLSKPILVFRNSQTNNIVAVDPKCTHQGCNVEFDADRQLLICPCHNSQFFLDGTVANKPAESSLTTYKTKQDGESIVVIVS
ncbi:MAG: ubiquinol-cytochrome c reductase iron-sulfur subunit [Pleurocapsa sp.]